MAAPIISFIPENDEAFKRGLRRLADTVDDFSTPFKEIGKHWYRGNRKIFGLASRGLYDDLGGFNPTEEIQFKGQPTTRREAAEVTKSEEVGFIFPLLKRKGALEASLSSRSGKGAVFFAGRHDLLMGTSISYAIFHQSDDDRFTLPQRKVIFISGGPAEIAKDSLVSGRREAWLNIMNDHINQVLTGSV